MTLTPEVHNLLYQTLGLTLYFCLYFSGLDSSTGLLYSKQTSYLLSFSPFRCSTSYGVPSDDSDSRGTQSSIPNSWINTLLLSLLLVNSTLRLDSSIASRHRIYSLSVPSGALPLVSHTECHLMTLTPEVHTLLYQTLGLTLYSCLYFSGLDSSTGLLYSKQTSLLSFSPFRCSTSCLPHGVPSDDSDSRGTQSSIPNTWINTLFLFLL